MGALNMATFKPLSNGAPTPSGSLDMSTFKPHNGATPPAPGTPAQAQPASITDNPKGEGLYQMLSPQGQAQAIPYSNVSKAASGGYKFVDHENLTQYARDQAADPVHEDQVDKFIDSLPWYDPGRLNLRVLEGLGSVALKTAAGADTLIHKATGEREIQPLQQAAASPSKPSVGGTVGEAGGNLIEYFTGEELLNMMGRTGAALNVTEKLKNASQAAQVLQRFPLLAKLARIGISAVKQGTVAGGQTYVNTGGDTGAAAGAGGATALLSAAIGGAGATLGDYIGRNATTVEDIGGVPTPVSAEARKLATTPAQQAGREAMGRAAQDTARGHLEELNESRVEPASATGLPARTGPFEFQLRGVPREMQTGQIAHEAEPFPPIATRVPEGRAPSPQNKEEIGSLATTTPARMLKREPAYMHASRAGQEARADVTTTGDLTTQDPNVARAHLANIDRAIGDPRFSRLPAEQQAAIREARADMQQQLAQYHGEVLSRLPGYGRPNFQPIDVERAVSQVGNYGDAAAAVKKQATDGYNRIMDALSFAGENPQQLTMVRNAYREAEAKFMGAETPSALQAAESEIARTHKQLMGLIAKVPNVVNAKEFSGLNDAYRNGLGLEKVARAVEGSFFGPMSSAGRNFEYSGFNGRQLLGNMNKLLNSMGRARIARLMGEDNLDTVLQVAQANTTLAQRSRFGAAMKPIADNLIRMHVGPIAAGGYLGHLVGVPWELGAAGGWAASAAMKQVRDAVLTNPQVAKNLMFAIQSGADPKNYGPFLATLIQRAATENAQPRKEDSDE